MTTTPPTAPPRPLDGITVVSLEHAIAAPFCTRQLADLGARVIKVERPGVGDFARAYDQRVQGMASHFVWVNRSKESLTLDLKQPAALAVLKQLIGTADVLVQNLAPGAAARMGLGYAELQAAHPTLIVCDISGYGDNGPYRDKKAYDLLIQSEAGFLSVTGTPDEPSKAGNSIADIAAGMYAYSSILAALMQRDKRGGSGKGAHIDVSMLEALTEWMGYPMYYAHEGAAAPPRSAASHATIYPYGPFAAGDGGTVMLGLQNEREWKLFCERVLQDEALATDARFDSNAHRNEHRGALKALILTSFASLTTAQVLARLDDAQIANARMNSMADVWAHPQLQARERWRQVDTPAGEVAALLPPGRISSFDYRMDPVPDVGQHTQAILRALGQGDAEIAALAEAGAI
jgi:crotonobetainyl-CoA:carnitine CoA-transferase CaiB-like acyl-CoA transferase